MATFNVPGAFLGTKLIQRSATLAKGKGVFVPLQGQKDEYDFPLYGGAIMNPFKGAAKLFAGDLAELRTDANGVNPKYYILKTFEVVTASSTTVKIKRGGFFHKPFVGDLIMVAPDNLGGTGTAARITAISEGTQAGSDSVTYDVYVLTVSYTLGSLGLGTILLEAEPFADSSSTHETCATMVHTVNSVCPCDYDFFDTPSSTYTQAEDTNFTDARYNVAFALGGTMFTKKMSPMPACVLALNQSNVNGWFRARWYGMKEIVDASAIGDNTLGVSANYSADAPTSSTKGKVGDILTNGSYIYVCTNVSGSTYTWKKVAIAS